MLKVERAGLVAACGIIASGVSGGVGGTSGWDGCEVEFVLPAADRYETATLGTASLSCCDLGLVGGGRRVGF